eukprot:CAMPEP_0114602570 /NCGR_PEP_ID=MMETSP0125-20121206/25146_1 /TAXON_ID=485358 ORGANISM="Aristerostoma sp., Strain ATCC 50986" /NCGR_SAMPLE_ID=MMETSP0125 /ASSEMBLY_ACC=CAM_ASM_000245 /LENGTH=64 /DNA_ID=CAMNT_0001812845 /DNA_START=1872 /DNA_END=2066 /DNA_ORIENTATION=+
MPRVLHSENIAKTPESGHLTEPSEENKGVSPFKNGPLKTEGNNADGMEKETDSTKTVYYLENTP